jgi:serine/threonine kinase 38
MTTCRKIVNWRTYLRFPPEAEATLSPAAIDFIVKLLCDVDDRLGTHGVGEIKKHPFFNGIDWDALYAAVAPYRPALEHELDTQNFEQYEDEEGGDGHGASSGHGGGGGASGGESRSRSRPVADPHFVGYTYKNWEATDAAAARQRVKETKAAPPRTSINELQDAFHAVELGGHR